MEFKTPAPSGKWEEEVSLGSIEVELAEVVELDEGEADDEVEYMPLPVPGEVFLSCCCFLEATTTGRLTP